MSIFLNVEISAGTDINEAARDAIELADRVGVTVMFGFNGVRCMACPGDNAARLAQAWNKAFDNGHMIARGRPEPPKGEA